MPAATRGVPGGPPRGVERYRLPGPRRQHRGQRRHIARRHESGGCANVDAQRMLPRRVRHRDGVPREQIGEYLVRLGNLMVPDLNLLEGEADVVAAREFDHRVGRCWWLVNQLQPRRARPGELPQAIEVAVRRPATKGQLAGHVSEAHRGDGVFESTPGAYRLAEPVEAQDLGTSAAKIRRAWR